MRGGSLRQRNETLVYARSSFDAQIGKFYSLTIWQFAKTDGSQIIGQRVYLGVYPGLLEGLPWGIPRAIYNKKLRRDK